MDKNQTIGLLLISLLLLGYFYFFGQPVETPESELADSTQVANTIEIEEPTIENTESIDSLTLQSGDSLQQLREQQDLGIFYPGARGNEEEVTLENEEVRIVFNSKGGVIEEVELKKYLTYDKQPLILLDAENNKMEMVVNTSGKIVDVNQLYYAFEQSKVGDTTRVSFSLDLGQGKKIRKSYSLPPTGYQLLHQLSFDNLAGEIGKQDIVFTWHDKMKRLEEHLDGYHGARKKATINYFTSDETFGDLSPGSDDIEEETVSRSLDWVSMKHKFFLASVISENGFKSAQLSTSFNPNDSSVIKDATAILYIDSDQLTGNQGNFKFYFGPNNYQIVKKVTNGFSKNVDMGWAMFSWINKIIIIPIFNFLERYISNYGIIIIILVLLIKLVLSPLSYKSYVSMAKTRVLKPELDELKEKYGNDMQKIQAEQMKLYQQVGVNPLSGCIPVVLQMPILLAMFNFFPNSVELRQESFLWANDLSTYDSILSWDANIPLISSFYGNHISLFTLLMTSATLLYTWSNNQMTAVQGPMKSIGYIMPIMFMFILNSYPAGLTFYYFVSTLVTFLQQTAIKRFVDEDKIRAILEQNKKKNKNKKKSKFQAKLEEAMKANEEQKKKNKK